MSISGQWNVVIESPMGAQKAVITLAQDGASLTGEISSDSLGSAVIENGSVNGNQIAFTADMKKPMPMTLSHELTIDGDTISGSVKAGAFGAFPLTGSRA